MTNRSGACDADAKELGRRGEQLACQFLEERGLVVLHRNWRCAEGELDIIATDGHRVYICEVKTRSGTGFGSPAESVTPNKRRKIRRLAQVWLSEYTNRWVRVQFDVISILWRRGQTPELTYLPAAF